MFVTGPNVVKVRLWPAWSCYSVPFSRPTNPHPVHTHTPTNAAPTLQTVTNESVTQEQLGGAEVRGKRAPTHFQPPPLPLIHPPHVPTPMSAHV